MNYKESIEYRKQLNGKYFIKEKLTEEEKYWLLSTPTFNPLYEDAFYQEDAIELTSNRKYLITVRVEHMEYKIDDMIPLFSGITKKDTIYTEDMEVFDLKNNIKKTPVRMLGLLNLKLGKEYEFYYNCGSGKLMVEYKCAYYDPKARLYKSESSICNMRYAMKKEQLTENKARYSCKHALADKNDLNGFVFTVEWHICDDNN